MTLYFSGRPFVPGGYGNPHYADLTRQQVEVLLRSWFAWLSDRSRIHVCPAGNAIVAELQVRRWITKEDVVLFRWRNSDSTRSVFEPVRTEFAVSYPEAVVEMTRRSGKPRALVLSARADDVLTPSWAMGLAISAFAAAGAGAVASFDLSTHSYVLKRPFNAVAVPLAPLSRSWLAGHKVGSAIGKLVNHKK